MRPTAAGSVTGAASVLLAPVTVTPTKPLTPSHLKGLLWTDVMYRATKLVADVTLRYSHTTYHLTEHVLGFWEYLDRTQGDIDYSAFTDTEIGQLYVAFRQVRAPATPAALRPYADAVEQAGWVHPASRRMLELWCGQFARMGLHDPGLTAHQPPGYALEEMVEHLAAHGMCLDLRPEGGPVYLDATRHGMPLRQIISSDGSANYLACALRELLPLVGGFDEVVLLHDNGLDADYRLLQRVLSRASEAGAYGATVRRVGVGRVPIDGRVASARHGGWAGLTAPALLDILGRFGPAELRLGLRLYFIAVLGRGAGQSMRRDLLEGTVGRGARLLAAARGSEPGADVAEILTECRAVGGTHVDSYRLTSRLLARHRPPAPERLLLGVYT
jgi:hypothetical protein